MLNKNDYNKQTFFKYTVIGFHWSSLKRLFRYSRSIFPVAIKKKKVVFFCSVFASIGRQNQSSRNKRSFKARPAKKSMIGRCRKWEKAESSRLGLFSARQVWVGKTKRNR